MKIDEMKVSKEEWESVIKQTESSLKDAVLSAEIFLATISHAKKQIKKINDDEQIGI